MCNPFGSAYLDMSNKRKFSKCFIIINIIVILIYVVVFYKVWSKFTRRRKKVERHRKKMIRKMSAVTGFAMGTNKVERKRRSTARESRSKSVGGASSFSSVSSSSTVFELSHWKQDVELYV